MNGVLGILLYDASAMNNIVKILLLYKETEWNYKNF